MNSNLSKAKVTDSMTVHYLAVVCNRPLLVMAGEVVCNRPLVVMARDSQGCARFPEIFHVSLGATESEV